MNVGNILLYVGILTLLSIIIFLVYYQILLHRTNSESGSSINEFTNIHQIFYPKEVNIIHQSEEPLVLSEFPWTLLEEEEEKKVQTDVLDDSVVLEIHSNTNQNPIILPSCHLKGLVVHKRGYLIIPSNTSIELDYIVIASGGLLHIEGSNIDIVLRNPMSSIQISSGGLLWARGITSSPISSTTTVALKKKYEPGTSVPLDLPMKDLGWDTISFSPRDVKFVMTSCTETYRDPKTNPVGGVPTWFNWEREDQKEANEAAIKEWETLTNNHGVEVVTLSSKDSCNHETYTVPLRFHHDHRGHAALLTRPIRIRSLGNGSADIDVEYYPKSPRKVQKKTEHPRGHWAYGLDGGTDGGHIEVGSGGYLDMSQVELWKLGSTMHYPIHVLGSAVMDACTIWCSFSGFVEISGVVKMTNSVCFWSLVTGILVHKESKDVQLIGNTIIGVHNAMPGTYWNEDRLIPRNPRDFYMTSSIWIDAPRTVCHENILCCSPSPVVGIWSRLHFVSGTGSFCENPGGMCPTFVPSESYVDNVCYNMEGFWSGIQPFIFSGGLLEDYKLVVAKGFYCDDDDDMSASPRVWMMGQNTFNVGPQEWTQITLYPRPTEQTWKDRTFFVLCDMDIPSTLSRHKTQLMQTTIDTLTRDSLLSDKIRSDLENEIGALLVTIDDLKEELVAMELKLKQKTIGSGGIISTAYITKESLMKDEFLQDDGTCN